MATDLIKALSRLAGNRQSDGTSSLISREDRETIINGCHDLMISARMPAAAPDLLKVVKEVKRWASTKCPCHEETPNPCTLCGASVENLEACKAVESVFPRDLLNSVNAAISKAEGRS